MRQLNVTYWGNLDTIPCARCNQDTQESRLRWRKTYTPAATPLDTLKHAYNCNFKIADDECVNQVISDVFGRVKESDDPAVRYFIHTLSDLPKGSVSLPCDIELAEEWPVADTYGIVKTRNGDRLGIIRYSIDSRWCAQATGREHNAKYARTKTDAMNWLANECTEVIEVAVDGSLHIPKRVMSPATLSRSSAGDGPWTPYKITLVDHAHGLKVGQKIKVRIGNPIPVQIVDGIISQVVGGLIEFSD